MKKTNRYKAPFLKIYDSSIFLVEFCYANNSHVGNGAVGFANSERNPSFSGGTEAKDVRRKTDLANWLVFLITFLTKKKVIEKRIPLFLTNNQIYLTVLFLFSVLFSSLPFGEGRGGAYAQTYPVNLTTQLTPPFTGYLPDYSALGSDKLRVLLLFNDFTKPAYNVKLKLKITGQGITLESKNYYYEGPFTVEPGVPLQLGGSDLSGLLNSNNLDFSGITKAQYELRKVLPEGFYSICITAYDANNPNPIKVSNESCSYGMMVLSDPPYLNLPGCGATLPLLNPQQLTFNWTPINQASPNSAGQTDYALELYEVRPAGQNPNNIVQTLPPIFTETITSTTFNYGPTEPPLTNGMQYLWRVRAIDQSGRDLFKNQGYSQICTFTWGSQYTGANLAINLAGVPLTYKQLKCTWDSLNLYTNYKLEFKKVGGTPTWFPTNTANARTKINNLEPNTDYLIHVTGQLPDGSWGPQSNEITLRTPSPPQYNCGDMPLPISPQTFVPLTQAANGQVWDIGQFEVLITGLENYQSPTGQYTGKGRVMMGFAGAVSFPVVFTNVTVNADFEVVAGRMDVRNNGIGTIVNIDDVLTNIGNWFNDFNNNHDTVALVNNLQQACNQAQQSGDSTFTNAFNDLFPITNSQSNTSTLFCSSSNAQVMQYLVSHPSAVSSWQGNANLFNSNSNSIATSTDQGYFSHGIQPTDYAEYKNWIAPAQDLATKKLNAGIYIITPSVNFNNKVVYYSAFYKWTVSATWFNSQNIPNDNGVAYRNDWTIEPKDLSNFVNNADMWGKSSAFLHNFGSDYKLRPDVIQYLDGNYLEALKLQWKAALKDPIFWLSLAHTSVSLFDASASQFSKTNFIKEFTVDNKIRTIWNTPYKINNSRIKLLLGSNKNKVAIIGREMNGHVKKLRSGLEANGINAEIFDKNIIPNETFIINGEIKTWAQLEYDLQHGNYSRNPTNNRVLDVDIPNTLMYKANKVWANKILSQGYNVLDAGYINNIYDKSLFYEMELNTLFRDGQ